MFSVMAYMMDSPENLALCSFSNHIIQVSSLIADVYDNLVVLNSKSWLLVKWLRDYEPLQQNMYAVCTLDGRCTSHYPQFYMPKYFWGDGLFNCLIIKAANRSSAAAATTAS